jgi:hypothetical protein
MIGGESIPKSQIGASFLNSSNPDSIPTMQVFFPVPLMIGCDSIRSSQIGSIFSDRADHRPIPTFEIESFTCQTADDSSISSRYIVQHYLRFQGNFKKTMRQGLLLGLWSLMSIAFQVTFPRGMDYVANARYSTNLSNAGMTILMAMIPTLTRIVSGLFWGKFLICKISQ